MENCQEELFLDDAFELQFDFMQTKYFFLFCNWLK